MVAGVFWIVRLIDRLEINPLRLRRTPPHWGRTCIVSIHTETTQNKTEPHENSERLEVENNLR